MTETEPWSYYPDGSPVYSLADIIRKRAAVTPALIALAEPGRLTSFAELDRRSSQVPRAFAHRLRSAGRPMNGARVRVVDPVTLEDCPSGSAARSWWPVRAS